MFLFPFLLNTLADIAFRPFVDDTLYSLFAI